MNRQDFKRLQQKHENLTPQNANFLKQMEDQFLNQALHQHVQMLENQTKQGDENLN